MARVPLYRQGPHYDAQNRAFVRDIPFYLKQAKSARGPVLELACGTGRITIPLAEAGMDIRGLDLEPSMLAQARKKSRQLGLNIEWIRGDCRNFALRRRFKLILMPFNAMQLLSDRESLEQLCTCVRRHLAKDGRFVLSVFNPNIAKLAWFAQDREPPIAYPAPDRAGTIQIFRRLRYDEASQVLRQEWRYEFDNGRETRIEHLNMRCFYPQELDALLHYNGFQMVRKLGDFDETPFRSASPHQICVCAPRH